MSNDEFWCERCSANKRVTNAQTFTWATQIDLECGHALMQTTFSAQEIMSMIQGKKVGTQEDVDDDQIVQEA